MPLPLGRRRDPARPQRPNWDGELNRTEWIRTSRTSAVQEMARVERMLRDEQIAQEVATYNALIPITRDLRDAS